MPFIIYLKRKQLKTEDMENTSNFLMRVRSSSFKLKLMTLCVLVFLSSLVVDQCNAVGLDAFTWASGSNNGVFYALGCDFNGNDIGQVGGVSSACGDICYQNSACDHFTWYNNVCYMKAAVDPVANPLSNAVCGIVIGRPGTGTHSLRY